MKDSNKDSKQNPEDDVQRGRAAEKPSDIPKKGWRDIMKRTVAEIEKDNMYVIAAGVAFYMLIALVPALVAVISIYGLVADPAQVQQQFAAISGVMPAAAAEMLTEQMQRIAGNNTAAGWGAVISIAVALWGCIGAMKIVTRALNIAYEEKETRSFIKLTGATLLLTLALIVLGIVALGAIVALPAILKFVGLGDSSLLVNLIRWPLLAIVAIVGLSMLYRFAPDREEPKWRWVTWGSVAAMILWVLGSAAFSLYVSNFGNYNEMYGSLAAIVIMMMWLYLSAFAVLLGAELNSEMEHQTAKDSTRRPHEPMGQRGAQVADELGESYA